MNSSENRRTRDKTKLFAMSLGVIVVISILVSAIAVGIRTFIGPVDVDLGAINIPKGYQRLAAINVNGNFYNVFGNNVSYSHGNFRSVKEGLEIDGVKAKITTNFNFYGGDDLIKYRPEADVDNIDDFMKNFKETATILGREMRYRATTSGIDFVYQFPNSNVCLYGETEIVPENIEIRDDMTEEEIEALPYIDFGEKENAEIFEIVNNTGINDTARVIRRKSI